MWHLPFSSSLALVPFSNNFCTTQVHFFDLTTLSSFCDMETSLCFQFLLRLLTFTISWSFFFTVIYDKTHSNDSHPQAWLTYRPNYLALLYLYLLEVISYLGKWYTRFHWKFISTQHPLIVLLCSLKYFLLFNSSWNSYISCSLLPYILAENLYFKVTSWEISHFLFTKATHLSVPTSCLLYE